MLTWKIAWRNVLRHKGKTLVVGVILFTGMLIMTLGNALMDGSKQGLQANLVNRFAGDIIVLSEKYKGRDVFFSGQSLQLFNDYLAVKNILAQQDSIDQVLPVARGQVTILNEAGISANAFFMGVKLDDYQRFSQNNVTALEGELLTNQSRGLLISDETRTKIFDRQKFWVIPVGTTVNAANLTPEARKLYDAGRLQVKTELVLVGESQGSMETDIRAPVRGIFQFQELNKWWAQYINFMDLESYRECFGHLTAGDRSAELSADQKALFAMDNADAMFTDNNLTTEVPDVVGQVTPDAVQQPQPTTIAGDVNLEEGAFSMALVKLKPGITLEDADARLRQALQKANLGVKTMTWRVALGEVADVSVIMQGLVFLFVLFIFFVAVIIIMNTLSMAALERSAEIGMMRAIGAKKGFIRQMFLTETFQIATLSGGLGIIVGIILVGILNLVHISVANNAYLGLLAGGNMLRPVVSLIGIILGLGQLLIVTVAASLYPIRIAGKITPLEAIARD